MNNISLENINKAYTHALPVLQEYVPDLLQEYDLLRQEKTRGDQKPVIMLYGMYSHGKSTLLNALLGREEAGIGKPPTTDRIEKYTWERGNCVIIDTPGIQAKLADTKVSKKELEKCELVAFVVQSGQYEEKLVWDTLVDMVRNGQKVYLIINDFDGCLDDPVQSEQIKNAFRIRLQRAASRKNYSGIIVEDVPLSIVNAKRALNARLEGKQELLLRSGLPDVEQQLFNLAASLNLDDAVNTLRRNLRNLIGQCHSKLSAKSGEKLLAEAEEQLSAITDERERAWASISMELDNKIAGLSSQLYQIYESSGEDKAAVQQALSRLVDGLVSDMTDVVKRETQHSATRIQEFCAEFDRLRLNLAPEEIDIKSHSSGQQDFAAALAGLDWSTLLKGMNWEESVQVVVVTVLKQLKEWFPKLFSGIGTTTMKNWGAAVSGIIGGVIAIGSILLQLYNDQQAEQEAIDQAQRRAQAISDAVTSTQHRLKDIFRNQLEKIFSETFDKLISQMSVQVTDYRQRSEADKNQRSLLSEAEQLLQV